MKIPEQVPIRHARLNAQRNRSKRFACSCISVIVVAAGEQYR
jgi:hypothetical protein